MPVLTYRFSLAFSTSLPPRAPRRIKAWEEGEDSGRSPAGSARAPAPPGSAAGVSGRRPEVRDRERGTGSCALVFDPRPRGPLSGRRHRKKLTSRETARSPFLTTAPLGRRDPAENRPRRGRLRRRRTRRRRTRAEVRRCVVPLVLLWLVVSYSHNFISSSSRAGKKTQASAEDSAGADSDRRPEVRGRGLSGPRASPPRAAARGRDLFPPFVSAYPFSLF